MPDGAMSMEYRPRVKVYLRSYRLAQLGIHAIDAVHTGFWLVVEYHNEPYGHAIGLAT